MKRISDGDFVLPDIILSEFRPSKFEIQIFDSVVPPVNQIIFDIRVVM